MAIEVGIEYQVFTPVKTFSGETAKVEFYRGRAVINDEYARQLGHDDAESLVRILVSDFGYTAVPELPKRTFDSRLSLRERAERAEGNIAPFFPGDPAIGATSESTIEPGSASKRGSYVEVVPADTVEKGSQ